MLSGRQTGQDHDMRHVCGCRAVARALFPALPRYTRKHLPTITYCTLVYNILVYTYLVYKYYVISISVLGTNAVCQIVTLAFIIDR